MLHHSRSQSTRMTSIVGTCVARRGLRSGRGRASEARPSARAEPGRAVGPEIRPGRRTRARRGRDASVRRTGSTATSITCRPPAADAWSSARRRSRALDQRVSRSRGRVRRAKVGAVRGDEQLAMLRQVALREEWRPHRRRRARRRTCRSSPRRAFHAIGAEVVEEREVAEQGDGGRGGHRRDRSRPAEERPSAVVLAVDAARAAVREHPETVARRHRQVEVADRRASCRRRACRRRGSTPRRRARYSARTARRCHRGTRRAPRARWSARGHASIQSVGADGACALPDRTVSSSGWLAEHADRRRPGRPVGSARALRSASASIGECARRRDGSGRVKVPAVGHDQALGRATNDWVVLVVGAAPTWITTSGRCPRPGDVADQGLTCEQAPPGRRRWRSVPRARATEGLRPERRLAERSPGHAPITTAPACPETSVARRSASSTVSSASGRVAGRASRPLGSRQLDVERGAERLLERAVHVHRSGRVAAWPRRLAGGLAPRTRPARRPGYRGVEVRARMRPRRAGPGRSSGSRRCRAAAAAGRRSAGTSGTRACDASTTAGRNSAAAVPLVHAIATGRRGAFASPSAKNALDRSSRWTCTVDARRDERAPARAASSATLARRTRGACRSRRARRRARRRTRGRSAPVAITSAGRSAPRSPRRQPRPSASSTPHAACAAAVPVRTGIRSRPVAVPTALDRPERRASHAPSPNSAHWGSPTDSSTMNDDDAERTIVANAATTTQAR